jgi:hypothetical protein
MSRSLTAFLVVVCLLGRAQTSHAQSISGGIKAGVTSARLPGVTDAIEITADEESRWGGTFGAFVTVPLNDLVAFQPEALYVVKGATVASSAANYSLKFDSRYLEIPLFARFGRSNRPVYFLAGPYFGFQLSAEGTETVGGRSETREFDDQFKSVDTGVSFGLGASFNRFLIEGRWSEGLVDIDNQDLSDTTVRHRVFALLAGFKF